MPDFVIELRFDRDLMLETRNFASRQDKMQEYLENGLRLGWLIDSQSRQVEIYRCDRSQEVVPMPVTLSG